MKAALLICLLIGAAVFVFITKRSDSQVATAPETDATEATAYVPYWEAELPSNLRLADDRQPKYDVVVNRRNEKQTRLEFQITEQQGLAADGITVAFWYQFQDEDDPDKEWIEDRKRITFVCTKRLEPNATLVESTTLMNEEFHHLGIDLATTKTENWRAQVVSQIRLMELAE